MVKLSLLLLTLYLATSAPCAYAMPTRNAIEQLHPPASGDSYKGMIPLGICAASGGILFFIFGIDALSNQTSMAGIVSLGGSMALGVLSCVSCFVGWRERANQIAYAHRQLGDEG